MADNKTWVGDDSGNEGDWSVAANWSPSGVPVATDHVRIPASSSEDITAGLNQSAVALGDVIVEKGYTGTIGTSAGYLQIDPNRFQFEGTGESYIDLGSAAIDVLILDTATAPATGQHGLYLKGSAIAILSVLDGDVAVAGLHGETATVTTARTVGDRAKLTLGAGVTLTNLDTVKGEATLRCACTTIDVLGGQLTTEEVGAITTLNVRDGTAYPNSTGTITTLNLHGGTVDLTGSGLARTITTLVHNGGAILYDPASVTITNKSAPDAPVRMSATPA